MIQVSVATNTKSACGLPNLEAKPPSKQSQRVSHTLDNEVLHVTGGNVEIIGFSAVSIYQTKVWLLFKDEVVVSK